MSSKRYQIEHEVSAAFRAAARRFHLTPQRLAELLCDDFAARPPKELIIVSCGQTPALNGVDACATGARGGSEDSGNGCAAGQTQVQIRSSIRRVKL